MFGNHGLGGLPEEGAHEKSPKCLGGNLGDFGEFCKGLGLLAIWLGVLLAIFVLLQFFNIVLWQLPIVGIVLVFAFYLLNKRGYSIPVFFRLVGFALAGRRARGRKTPKYKM